MNKVVSIELAKQVFWIDEDAFGTLRAYLDKLKSQLGSTDGGDEIYRDIELRIAELFFAAAGDGSKAVSAEQVEDVIAQVGYLEAEADEPEANAPASERRSYRDRENGILGGVCAGLARRYGVPAFVMRVLFVALTLVFGLGAVLYLIFWASLGTPDTRKAELAAEGRPQTASALATPRARKSSPLLTLQRIIFLPVSIVGALATVVAAHYRKRKSIYGLLVKNALALALGGTTFVVLLVLFETRSQPLFPWPISWLVIASVIYLLTLGLAMFVRGVYLDRPRFEIAPILKRCAVIPAALLVIATTFLNLGQSDHHHEEVVERLQLTGSRLTLVLREDGSDRDFARAAQFRVRPVTTDAGEATAVLRIDYGGYGADPAGAEESARAIEYRFAFDDDQLSLDRYWGLHDGALSRGQSVQVVLEVPEGVELVTQYPLAVSRSGEDYEYALSRERVERSTYLSTGAFLHEFGEDFANKLSRNERDVLEDRFCEEFFMSESWRCPTNIALPVLENDRFDRAFEQDAELVDELREYLLPDRSIFVGNLREMNDLVNALSVEYRVRGAFQGYLEELMLIKAVPEVSAL